MRTHKSRALALLAASGTAMSIGAAAMAQPVVVNIAGATLLENFFKARASTVDYIDADGNGVARGYPISSNQQLAPFFVPDVFPNNQVWGANVKWIVMYSAVGSTNGYQELIDHGRGYVTVPGTNTNAAQSLRISARTAAYYNRYKFINAGAANDDSGGSNPEVPVAVGQLYNDNNPMGSPVRSTMDGNFSALYTSRFVASTSPNEGLTAAGGLTIDLAPLDVPTTWATRQAGTPGLTLNPLQTGYGDNPREPMDKDGRKVANGTRSNKLATLTGGANLSSTPPGVFNPAANSNTIFDTSILVAHVCPVINFGVGRSQITISELRYLFTAGRLPSGENLMVVNRDSGSGTRNAWDNSLGYDPSFGVGDNTGPRNNGVQFDRLGPSYLPSNKQGNNRVEPAVYNHRLAIGYVGPERGVEQGWLTNGLMEICDVRNDTYGGNAFVRPTIDRILDNDANGYVIFGPSVVATFGDPLSSAEALGGLGWMERYQETNGNPGYQIGEAFNDLNNNGFRDAVEPRPGSLNPAMRNPAAAAYINNITRSIFAFVNLPGADQTVFTPGEFAATQFVLVGALDNLKQSTPSIDPSVLAPNPGLNPTLQEFIRTQAGSVYTNVAYTQFGRSVAPFNGNSRAGKVPFRSTLAQLGLLSPAIATNPYSDAALNAAADKYVIENAALTADGESQPGVLTYGANLPLRNLIAGDFNANGVRDAGDVVEMLKAWRKRYQAQAWSPLAASGALASLSVSTGQSVDPGLTSIEIIGDFDGDGSFTAGDVRYYADGLHLVAGQLDRKAGFTAVDTQWQALTGGNNFFGTTLATPAAYTAGAARADVANGAGRVTPAFAPTGADGGVFFYSVGANNTQAKVDIAPAQRNRIDAFDIDYIYRQFKQNAAVTDGALNWSNINEAISGDLSCDLTGDLIVDQNDISEILLILGTSMGDVNLDGSVNAADQSIIVANLNTAGGWAMGDLNGDGQVNSADLTLFNGLLACSPADIATSGNPDPNAGPDGFLTGDDFDLFINAFFNELRRAGDNKLIADLVGGDGNPPPDTFLTGADFDYFITQFFLGC